MNFSLMCKRYCRTYNSSAFLKQEFLNKWIKGLQIYTNNFTNEPTLLQRQKAIKLSADVAIASTRHVATHWSQALMARLSAGGAAAKTLVEEVSGRNVGGKRAATITCSKKIVRRSCRRRRRVVPWSGRKLVRNRVGVLKRLVPGGQDMNGVLLIQETLDYIASLQVQVDVMRHLAAVGSSRN